jgi:quinol monooxygenase YgiN
MPLILVATITPLPDERAAVRAALEEAVPVVHEEEGCQKYALHEAKDSFVLVEQWADKDALNAHAAGEPFARLTAALKDKVVGEMDVKILRPILGGTTEQGQLV